MTVGPGVLTGALRAQSQDVPVRLRTVDGATTAPARIVERLIRQQRVNDCTVAVRLEGGAVYHLGDVVAVLGGAR